MSPEPVVYVVDDDAAVRDSLSLLLNSHDLDTKCFDSADAFLEEFQPERTACVIMDLRMPGCSGLDCQDLLAEMGASVPLIFLTGHADVPDAVQALKKGAVDFLQKPVTDEGSLLAIVRRSLQAHEECRRKEQQRGQVRQRLQDLTDREREVISEVAAGKANKVIAIDLDISERTVEIHRGRAMRKLGVRNVAELMKLLGNNNVSDASIDA